MVVAALDYAGSALLELVDARTLRTHGPLDTGFGAATILVANAIFSPDSRVLTAEVARAAPAVGSDAIVRWDARTEHRLSAQAIAPAAAGAARALAGYTAGGTQLVTSSAAAGTTVLRDATGLEPRRVFRRGGSPAAVSADGRFVVLVGRGSSRRLLDLHTGRDRAVGTGAVAAQFTPDSRWLVTSTGARSLAVWDTRRAVRIQTIGRLTSRVRDLAIAADSRTAYTAGEDGSIIGWDLTGRRWLGRPFRVAGRGAGPLAALSARSSVFAVADVGGVDLLDGGTLTRVRRINLGHATRTGTAPSALAITPDGRTLARGTASGELAFADVATGRLLGPPVLAHVRGIRDAVFTSDGRRLATTDGSVVYLWDVARARPIRSFEGVTGGAASLGASPDGKLLVVADVRQDGTGALDILRLPRLQMVRQTAVPPPVRIEFSRDGKVLFLGDQDGRVWLLDTQTWRPLGAPLAAQSSPGPFAVDPDRPPPRDDVDRRLGATLGSPIRSPIRQPTPRRTGPTGPGTVQRRRTPARHAARRRPRLRLERRIAVLGSPGLRHREPSADPRRVARRPGQPALRPGVRSSAVTHCEHLAWQHP